jgi:hypothetical protein
MIPFSIDSNGYVLFTTAPALMGQLWRFDPATHIWQQVSDWTWALLQDEVTTGVFETVGLWSGSSSFLLDGPAYFILA